MLTKPALSEYVLIKMANRYRNCQLILIKTRLSVGTYQLILNNPLA